jgi:alpha-tubulin suppressor-like RCC1 family protein
MTRVNATGSNIKLRLFGNRFTAVLVWLSAIVGQLAVQTARADELLPLQSGSVWAWGSNAFGELGDGTTTGRLTPVQTVGLTNAVAIVGGRDHSLALRSDGTVWAWGSNSIGQLGDGTATDRLMPVQVLGLAGVVAIAGSRSHTLALLSDGTVWGWGQNIEGQLGDGTNTNRATPVQVVGLSDVVAVAVGSFHSLALRGDGTVWAWGSNNVRQLGNGTASNSLVPVQTSNLTDVVAIAASGSHSLALLADGTVWGWGRNGDGELGDGTTNQYLVPVQTLGLTDVVQVACGGGASANGHSLAVTADGKVWAWGENSSGQLGDGTTSDRWAPVQTISLTDVVSVAAGGRHSLALRAGGTVWAWGQNSGRLGDGTTINRSTPVQTVDMSNVVAVAAGHFHSLAIVGNPNTPPVAVASIVVDGEDVGTFVELACESHDGTLVTLNASNSSDPDGDDLEVEWSVAEDSGIVIDDPTAAITEAIFPLGVHEVTLTVYDLNDLGERKGQLGLASVTIIVMDDQPPVALVTTSLVALWPANKTMIPLELLVVASDHCVAPEELLVFCTITSNQPDDSNDSGEHVGDVDGHDGYTAAVEIELLHVGNGQYAALVYLRAERDGDDKAGRVYSINVEAIDDSENVGYATTTVVVPHNQGKQQ